MMIFQPILETYMSISITDILTQTSRNNGHAEALTYREAFTYHAH